MAEHSPWQRLIKAAKEAQDLIAAEHHNESAGDWDSDDAMQVYENIECALLDVQEAESELLAALEGALPIIVAWYEENAKRHGPLPEGMPWLDAANDAIRKARG